MTRPADPDRSVKLVLAAALAAFVAVGLWRAGPWTGTAAALRPDTGTPAAALREDELSAVLTELLTRVYAAFGQQEEGAIYDGLATAVASDLLTDLYLQRRAAQLAEYDEGGTTEIRQLDLTALTPLGRSEDGYRVSADWTVLGEVGHVDHRHERLNAYSAVLTLGPADGEWRLTAFDLNRVRREPVPFSFGEEEPVFLEDLE